ncbi:DUF7344 domain-containing protein [Halomontanus rarus]|uniref:DUF7344 domain-containing protein n=1 Tax=Halomontanus rarus TaxID=3034020 RepID=UPI003CE49151
MGNNPQLDRLFDCLTHHQRRAVINIVRNLDSPKSTSELAQDIVVETHKSPNIEVPSTDSIRTLLSHSHLPKLKEAGLIEYDEERALVAPNEFTARSGIIVEIGELVAGTSLQSDTMTDERDDKKATR